MTLHILVTGGSRGIGAAIVDELSDDNVLVHATSSADGDLSDPAVPSQIWEAAMEQMGGRIDILINNAGVFEPNPIESSDIEWLDGWERTMAINLTASAQLCRLAVLHWLERGQEGRIINVASRAGHRGDSPLHWHYAASKGGMLAMT
ncbi:MAG: hypothetical protein RIQ28_1823, partial [Pseudomonadota bacterium]